MDVLLTMGDFSRMAYLNGKALRRGRAPGRTGRRTPCDFFQADAGALDRAVTTSVRTGRPDCADDATPAQRRWLTAHRMRVPDLVGNELNVVAERV